jgi:hypothetical protein
VTPMFKPACAERRWTTRGATAGATVTVDVELRFQPIGYRWAQNLAAYDAPEPTKFLGYYKGLASSASVVVARASRSVSTTLSDSVI